MANAVDHKVEHEMVEDSNGSGAPLSRQVTVTMSPEQYERLFFQPQAPRGDLAKRLGKWQALQKVRLHTDSHKPTPRCSASLAF